MTTRAAEFMKAMALNLSAFGQMIGADQSVASRLKTGAQQETGQQRVLLDLLAEKHNLPHLHSSAYQATPEFPASAGSEVARDPRDMPSMGSEVSTLGSLGVSSLDCPGHPATDAGAISGGAS